MNWKKKPVKKGKDIVAGLNSQLVDMYMASILSNLYTAQQNVQSMVDVQSGNISNFQKSLLTPAVKFQDIFPALVSSSDNSLTANEALKQSLDKYSDLYDGLLKEQSNYGKSLADLLKQEQKIRFLIMSLQLL
ncbi:hypothetical protein N1495_00660 [Streptococcus didelphis]|uniref:hypothetical protein n=1 Tax=Streptococcus didelphis TaxID=102886 RepID=UPI0004773561|nr:hypothetical protein [Streptococcus didelphis]WMB29602.1 hypothetical protein N1495_00660 [Streptococcus didelphis]